MLPEGHSGPLAGTRLRFVTIRRRLASLEPPPAKFLTGGCRAISSSALQYCFSGSACACGHIRYGARSSSHPAKNPFQRMPGPIFPIETSCRHTGDRCKVSCSVVPVGVCSAAQVFRACSRWAAAQDGKPACTTCVRGLLCVQPQNSLMQSGWEWGCVLARGG